MNKSNFLAQQALSRRRFLQAISMGMGGGMLLSRMPYMLAAAPRASETVIPPPPVKYDPVLHISQNYTMNGAIEFINDETVEDNVWSRWLEANMGLRYDVAWAASGSGVEQKWSTSLASGELPEYFSFISGDVLGRLLNADQLEDITEIWERVASPLTKEKKGYPDGILWRPFRDGRVRALPLADAEIASNDSLLWMRKDWLDQLGLEPPQTLDELGDVARAFREAGLSQMGIAVSNNPVNSMSGMDVFFGAFGAMPTYWRLADGGLTYGSIQPQIKDALALLSQWRAEGLIDQEFATKDTNATMEDYLTGRAGIVLGPWWFSIWPLPDAKLTDPNADWAFYDIPAGPEGVRGRRAHRITGLVCAFRKGVDPQKVEAVIQELNWTFERRANWVANHDYHNAYGPMFDGYDYVVEGDEAATGPTPVAGPWAYAGSVQGNPAAYPYPDMLIDYNRQLEEIAAKDPATLSPVERWLVQDPALKYQRDAYEQVYNTLDYQILNDYMGIPSTLMSENMATLNRLENEVFLGIISGERPVDDFDTFVTDWLARGGQEVTDEVNAWYAGS